MIEIRRIRLGNVMYKLILKVIANWLKLFLSNIIADSLSAFGLEI